MEWDFAYQALGRVVMTRAELLACGATSRALTIAVRSGELVRVRRDHYALPHSARDVIAAVRVGGRLGCVSALASYGVFVFDNGAPHIHIDRGSSRLRAPAHPLRPLSAKNRGQHTLHWNGALDDLGGDEVRVSIVAALAQAVSCQQPWHAIASLDNALHLGLIGEDDLERVFSLVPLKYRWMREQLDGRAEAGQESVLRMIVLDRRLHVTVQPTFAGIGRADMLVEECLVLEADSRQFHSSWEEHVEDRRRDLAFARLGFASLRPAYQHTMYHPDLVGDAVVGLVHEQQRFLAGPGSPRHP